MTKPPIHPLVSVIIPAYNAEKFLVDSVESVLRQSYTNFELIIIDDFSSDGTGAIADHYALSDTRVSVLHNEGNLGIGGSRARGVTAAQGKYLAWLDADDLMTPERLEKQIEFLEANPHVGVVGGYIELFGARRDSEIRKYALSDQLLRKRIFRQSPVASPASTYRSEVFQFVGNYADLKSCEDLEMVFRTGTKYEFANVPLVVTRYRQHDASITRQKMKSMEFATFKIRLRNVREEAYHLHLSDIVFNLVQLLSVWLPTSFRMQLFDRVRKS